MGISIVTRCFCVLIFSLIYSCNLFINNDDIYKSPRSFNWSIDTLSYPDANQTLLEDVWGSSLNNIYAVGFCTTVRGTMWEHDGANWDPTALHSYYGGVIDGHFYINDVNGTSKDDVWAVGYLRKAGYAEDSSLVVHFDGNQWSQIDTPPGFGLTTVTSTDKDNVWLGGYYGTLFHYDGNKVVKLSPPLPDQCYSTTFGYFKSIASSDRNNIYAIYFCFDDVTNSYFIHYDGSQWQILDEFFYTDFKQLWLSPSGTIYSAGRKNVFEWSGSSWVSILNDFDFNFNSIYGTDDSNILIGGYNISTGQGDVRHFNGSNWERIPLDFDVTTVIFDIWMNDRGALLISHTSGIHPEKTITIQGR